MGQGHPCAGWLWAALPKISPAPLLLLSGQKMTTGCLFERKQGGRKYEGERPVRARRARALVGPSHRLDQGLGLPECWERCDPGSQFRPSFNAKICHIIYLSSPVPLPQLRVSG